MKAATSPVCIGCVFATFLIAIGAGSVSAKPLFSLQAPIWIAASSAAASQGQLVTPKKAKKAKKAKGKKGGGVTFYEGSGETRAERDRRLSRECKGRANSGLCEGYTR